MGLISNFAEDCPECGSSDWRLHDSNLKCQRCGFVVDPQEVRKEPMDALKVRSWESRKSRARCISRTPMTSEPNRGQRSRRLEVLEFERDRVVMGQPEKAGIIRHFVMFILTGWWTLRGRERGVPRTPKAAVRENRTAGRTNKRALWRNHLRRKSQRTHFAP